MIDTGVKEHVKTDLSLQSLWMAFEVGVVAALALLSFLLICRTTASGIGISPDSCTYILAGQSLAKGHGYEALMPLFWEPESTRAVIEFPPGYSAFLALISPFCHDMLAPARVAAILLFVFNTILVYFLAKMVTSNIPLSALACVFFVFSPDMIFVHTMAYSEGLFCSLTLLMLLGWTILLKSGSKTALIVAALSASFALITRYVGMVWIPASIIFALIGNEQWRFKRRVTYAGVFAVMGLIPAYLLLRNHLMLANFSGRQFALHLWSTDEFMSAAQTISNWLFPQFLNSIAGVISILILLCTLLYWSFRHSSVTPLRLVLFFGVCFLCFVFIARMATPVHIELKVFSPAYPLVVIGLIGGIRPLAQHMRHKRTLNLFRSPYAWIYLGAAFLGLAAILYFYNYDQRRQILFAAAAILCAAYGITRKKTTETVSAGIYARTIIVLAYTVFFMWRGASAFDAYRLDGANPIKGYNTQRWWRSATLQEISKNTGRPLFSNTPWVVGLYLNRTTRYLPTSSKEFVLFRKVLCRTNGIVVFFTDDGNPNVVDETELVQTGYIRLKSSLQDGRIYECNETK